MSLLKKGLVIILFLFGAGYVDRVWEFLLQAGFNPLPAFIFSAHLLGGLFTLFYKAWDKVSQDEPLG